MIYRCRCIHVYVQLGCSRTCFDVSIACLYASLCVCSPSILDALYWVPIWECARVCVLCVCAHGVCVCVCYQLVLYSSVGIVYVCGGGGGILYIVTSVHVCMCARVHACGGSIVCCVACLHLWSPSHFLCTALRTWGCLGPLHISYQLQPVVKLHSARSQNRCC